MPVSASNKQISFFFPDTRPTLKNRAGLKRFILSIFKKEKKNAGAINYVFCTDRALLDINRRYLKHNFYTDIITFDLSEGTAVQADIYISIDRVRENAQKIGVTLKEETHRVIFHGVLHLCGYKDKSAKDAKIMREKEEFYLSKYF
ncbi:MAG: rRNA maturation RNase YbeY [Chitinophagaceae bacterium]